MYVASEVSGVGGRRPEPPGCAFYTEIGDRRSACGAACQPGSPYCPEHHARCHVRSGSAAERRRLREAEALADAVGGRRGRLRRGPSERFLRRLERAARGDFLRPIRSRIVPKGAE